MSRLFVSLYLDEDVDALLARLLTARGYAVLTTHDAGRRGSTDGEQLDFAASGGMAIVTHNRVDFDRLAREYVEAGRSHAGMFIAARRQPYELARRLLVLLNQITADEMRDQVLYL